MSSVRRKIRLDHSPEQQRLLKALNFFQYGVFLNSNHRADKYDWLFALDALEVVGATIAKGGFDALSDKIDGGNDWWFGHLGYDLKNDVERLPEPSAPGIPFEPYTFFRPRWVVTAKGGEVNLFTADNDETEFLEALAEADKLNYDEFTGCPMAGLIDREEYIKQVESLLNHIGRGDIYEVNFCKEFRGETSDINPLRVYEKLNEFTQAPFSALLKEGDLWAASGSPERFMKKSGQTLLSQPIKGTARRVNDPVEDRKLAENLALDQKERAENVMIVDLVRNDLSRSCKPGTVHVPELFGVYTFKSVHQLISTVQGEIKDGVSPLEAIRNAFPMGSMTGAPKVRAMELIDQYEETSRGLYSGSIGYFTPQGDFDFNVVIRTILMDTSNRKVSYSVGGAITAKSTAEGEYDECQVKAEAMQRALS